MYFNDAKIQPRCSPITSLFPFNIGELRSEIFRQTHVIGLVEGTAITLTAPSSSRPPPPPPLPPLKFLRRSLVAWDAARVIPPGWLAVSKCLDLGLKDESMYYVERDRERLCPACSLRLPRVHT